MDCLYVRFYRKCEAFFKEKQIRFDILKFLYKVLPVLEAAVYCGLIIYSFVKEDYLMFTKYSCSGNSICGCVDFQEIN